MPDCADRTEDSGRAALTQAAARRRGPGAEPLAFCYFWRIARETPRLIALLCLGAAAPLTPAELAAIDAAAKQTLQLTGVPAASVAVVRGDQIVATRAYGSARIAPALPAAPEMAFAIGSISKQFTAAMILLLAQDGKLSLDDHVGRFCRN
ncbi:MAG: serine hydrolase domain-containing protein [Rhodospirillales bacterium]